MTFAGCRDSLLLAGSFLRLKFFDFLRQLVAEDIWATVELSLLAVFLKVGSIISVVGAFWIVRILPELEIGRLVLYLEFIIVSLYCPLLLFKSFLL